MIRPMIPDTFWTTQEELLLFGCAVLLALPAGVLFDLLRLFRRLIPHHPLAVALEDVLWLLTVSLLLLLYATAFAKGVFRVYYAAGCLLGFVIYLCTIGRVTVPLLARLLRTAGLPAVRLGQGFAKICTKVRHRFVKSSKKLKIRHKNARNPLQDPAGMVYNVHRKKKKGYDHGKKSKTPKR